MSEQNITPESQKSQGQKFKTKEFLSTEELKSLLKGWLDALDQNKDFEFQIKGNSGKIPKDALLKNTTSGEYEFKNGEYEFELELKWKEESEKFQ